MCGLLWISNHAEVYVSLAGCIYVDIIMWMMAFCAHFQHINNSNNENDSVANSLMSIQA